MSLWARAQQLPPESLQKVRTIYGDHFPIEVRHCLAPWIESRIWTAEPEEQQRFFVDELVQEIQAHADLMLSPDMFVTKMKLLDAAKNFHMQYSHAPHELYAYMRRSLALEMDVIQNAMGTPYVAQPQTERKYSELITGLQTVRQKVNMVGEEIRSLQANIESFSLQYHECLKNKGHMNYLQQSMTNERRDLVACLRVQIEETERKLNALVAQISQSQMELVDHMKENIANLRQLQSQVLDEELIKWKREQQLSGNGVPMQSNLNTIQEWCELLADLIWTSRQQVNNVARINTKTIVELRQPHLAEMLDEMSKQVTGLLSTLVTSTFVIEKQPPQVMKTNTRFTATVRLLVGGQLNVYMTPPRVSVVIISEQQAQLLLKSETQAGKGKQPVECGDILNNTGTMEYQPTSRQLSVSFRNMQLRKIKRAEKKGTESVMDEKLTLLFQSQFNVGGGELVFQVWTLSLPVVVIVHGNQEPHGWATVTWDNAFSPPGRVPFAVPDKVTWGQLAETLRIKFCSATGGDLSEDNLRFLAEKIFSICAVPRTGLPLNTMELNAMPVSWTQFCKDALPERNFTFWEWFYMVVKVTRDYLRTLWCDHLIMGFIQKKQAEEMLSKCPAGTFLLRFSDSELGGITIAWVGEGNEVFSLQPFTSRDLMLRSLADRVLDLTQLQFLYPNIAKDDVFSKYYTKPENEMLKNGYVKPVLVTTLPPYMSSSPAYAHSPDSHRNTPSVQSSYFSAATPAQTDSFMDSELFEQIRAFEPDGMDEFDIYSNMSMK
ncbi:signal transducer and activator of transcription 5B isoform X1 [Helicoverpa zea]|nr:signal transducer and activator of transcription 5B isoform X1 [Helicoverpa zea]XP_047039668.1 signal transducer and activator of transcription 5B isoform X1 [Helicoverpa zea]XP_047039670.1 signal transducer and activator of transcription 5B isoform X1 [Helicoverpa zea]XP_047039671.1 signal transducer and activator of transcription 5B isoform X1 [Helicoverpa zea]XP_049695729.1 signal transducer and activator of transcription 5B isoform X1 [Helicoverpa armigera]XP_049695730.1 signal transduc